MFLSIHKLLNALTICKNLLDVKRNILRQQTANEFSFKNIILIFIFML